jgi:acyl transferase domain-containing protein
LPPALRRQLADDVIRRIREVRPRRAAGQWSKHEASRVAGIISDTYRLDGPGCAVDAACASSLIALSLAANAIHRGTIDQAIVGGASHSNWFSLVMFSQAQALSATGSFPFDSRADGFISSDGFAAIIIKPLARAVAERNKIFGVIRGIGVATDGRGKSLWAPRKEGQVAAIERAYSAGIDPASVEYVEAHGTSTQLGDATELEALALQLGGHVPSGRRVPVSSVKANIGHTRETAGLAGLVKTLLCMHHGRIPAVRYLETLNPLIPWEKIPFFVPTADVEWPATPGKPRRAGIDAFGIGGLNAHVIVDDGPETESTSSISVPSGVGSNGAARMESVPAGTSGDRPQSDSDAVAIISVGLVAPGSRTLADFNRLVDSGADPKSDVPRERWDWQMFYAPGAFRNWRSPIKRAGFVHGFEYDWKKNRIPPKQVERADPLQFMLLDAADQALNAGGKAAGEWPRERTGVVVGTGFGGDFAVELNRALRIPEFLRTLAAIAGDAGVPEAAIGAICNELTQAFHKRHPVLEDETGSYTSSTLSSRITKTFDLMGGALSLDAGAASSFAALGCAVDRLLLGQNDLIICAAGQRALDVSACEWLAAGGLLETAEEAGSRDHPVRGLVPGEAAVALLLKRLADAKRDGDPILAVIRGYGAARHPSGHCPAVAEAIRRALESSGISAAVPQLVEAAAIGVPRIDSDEAAAIAEVFGNGRTAPLTVGTLAQQFGFCQGAAGLLSLAKVVHLFDSRRIPGNFAGETALADGLRGHAQLCWSDGGRRLEFGAPGGGPIAGVTCCALDPFACHVLLEHPACVQHDREHTPSASSAVILRLGASSLEDLQGVVSRSEAIVEEILKGPTRAFTAQDRARLAVVADSIESLKGKLRLACEKLQDRPAQRALEEQGIFIGEAASRPARVAVVFSGQGSQYAGMFRELVAQFPPAAEIIQDIDRTLERMHVPRFETLAWEAEKIGTDVLATQLAVLTADYLAFEVLRAAGVRPDVLSAHSYGEYAALVAAGCWSLETAVAATIVRSRAIENCDSARGCMLSTTAPGPVAEEVCRESGGDVFVANLNAPDQTVLGGSEPAVAAVAARLQSAGFVTREIPVPRPFHTPLMAGVRDELRAALDKLPVYPPRIPFLSSVTNRYTADPADIRDNLVEQLVRPVRYVELVQRLLADDVTVFVEAGPRQVLTRLTRGIIGARPVAAVSFDNPKRPGMESLLRARAVLECAGWQFDSGRPAAATNGDVSSRVEPRDFSAEIVHFDATAVRREKMRRGSPAAKEPGITETPAAAPAAEDPETGELRAFLVNFVCEQTGYPPEVVGLDSDLEADLGIDSIKKAQMLGELRETYEFQPAKDLTLAAFPTLRHILEYLKGKPRRAPAPAAGGATPPERQASPEASGSSEPRVLVADRSNGQPAPPDSAPADAPAPPEAPAADAWKQLNVARFRGSPREMGRQHGTRESAVIQRMIASYAGHIDGGNRILDEIRFALTHRDAFLDEAGLEELAGIAETTGIGEAELILYNFGLCYDFVPGCSQFAVSARRNNVHGLVHAVNEDWPLGLLFPGQLKRLVQVRFPEGGVPYVLFGTSGQVGGLNGFNAAGLCVSSTLLTDRVRPERPQPGLIHPVLVRTVLERAASLEEAIDVCRSARRSGAWSLCISDNRTDRIRHVEYDAGDFHAQERDAELVASTNHGLLNDRATGIPEHSLHRYERLRALLEGNGHCPAYSAEFAQGVLTDLYDSGRRRKVKHATMSTIRRVDTQASIVMLPGAGKVRIAHPQDSASPGNEFLELDMNELFNDPGSQDAEHLMRRFVMRTVDSPLPRTLAPFRKSLESVAILGDGPLAAELQKQLGAAGLSATVISTAGSADKVFGEFEECLASSPVRTLVLLAGRDASVATAGPVQRYSAESAMGTMVPFRICQRWLRGVADRKEDDPLTLVAVTALGGNFGFQSMPVLCEGGALGGLVKAIRREFPQVAGKVVDSPVEEPLPLVATRVLEELACGNGEVEVTCVRGKRRVVRMVPRPASLKVQGNALPSGVWVATGGARGITARMALELGREFGLTLHVIGSSPMPDVAAQWLDAGEKELQQHRQVVARIARESGRKPSDDWREFERALEIARNLRTFKTAGIRAVYHSCDLGNRDALAQVLDSVRKSGGPIRGILHGAGVESANRLDRKKLSLVQATIAAKADGAVHLIELTQNDPLEHFVAFGSVSGRFGGIGQADYSLASDLLAKVVSRLRGLRPDVRAVTFHWPAWDEVGMAMRPESKVVLESSGLRFMPLREGAAHLMAELRAGCPEAEVLFADPHRRFDAGHSLADEHLFQEYRRLQNRVDQAPLIEGIDHLDPGKSLVAGLRFDPSRDRFLIEHQHLGIPILPVVVGLEAAAEAATILADGRSPTEFRDVHVLNGFRFYRPYPAIARVEVVRESGALRCELRGEFYNREGRLTDSDRPYLRARVAFGSDSPVAGFEIPTPPTKWGQMQYPTPERARDEGWVLHGPAFRCLNEVAVKGEECWGRLVLPAPGILGGERRAAAKWLLPSVALDVCLQICGVLLVRLRSVGELPEKLDRIVLGRLPRDGEQALVYARLREIVGRHTRFDVIMAGAEGDLLLAVEGYRGIMSSVKERGDD